MKYQRLFDLLYSNRIPDSLKEIIINRIVDLPLEESHEVSPLTETYIELLNTLVYSTVSEALIYSIIDEAFSQLSEEAINEVSDEWVKRKVQDSMKARQRAADSANKSVKSGVVGLSQLRRQDQAQSNLEKGQAKATSIMNKVERRKEATKADGTNPYTPKAESGAINKLKSAVGKVKSFVSQADKGPSFVGLSRSVGPKTNQSTTSSEAPKTEIKQPELKKDTTPKAKTTKPQSEVKTEIKQPKLKTKAPKAEVKQPTQQKLNLESNKQEIKQPELKSEVKMNKPTNSDVNKDVVKAAKNKVANSLKTEAPKVEAKPEIKQEAPKVEKLKKERTPKAENKPKAEAKSEVKQPELKSDIKPEKSKEEKTPEVKAVKSAKTEDEKYEARLRREAAARRKDQEKQLETLRQRKQELTAKPGYDQKHVDEISQRISDLEKKVGVLQTSEAIFELSILLAGTNISESSFFGGNGNGMC